MEITLVNNELKWSDQCGKAAGKVMSVLGDRYIRQPLNHITTVVRSCNYHIYVVYAISVIYWTATLPTHSQCSIVATRIDYCNSLLYGISHKNLDRLQRVQNSLARVVCDVPLRSPSTPLLSTLNWLPIEHIQDCYNHI